MREWMKEHMKTAYLIINIVISVILSIVELMFQCGLPLIHTGFGGECDVWLTFGGNVVTYLYPMGDVSHPISPIYEFHFMSALIVFFLRFLIVIPLTRLCLFGFGNFDYSSDLEGMKENKY